MKIYDLRLIRALLKIISKRSMQSTIDTIIEQLESLLENAKNMESRYLSEILALQKLVNHTQKCIQYIPPKESIKQIQKKEPPQISVQDKVNALMNDIEARQKIIQNQKIQTKHKFEVKLPEIVVEKKPPIPTANRNEKVIRNQPPAYVPPRNKNEVTGKVTQTTMRTSGQKVFRPEKTSIKKVESKDQVKNKGNRLSVQKLSQKRQVKPDQNAKRSVQITKKEVEILEQSKEIVPQKQITPIVEHKIVPQKVPEVKKGPNKVKFASFHKQIDQILSQLFKQGPKNHKSQLQKLINDCQNQQKGHKMHEDNNRRIFIKKVNNYAASRHAVYPMTSYEITRNKWYYYPQLSDFQILLDSVESQLANLLVQKDCRIDKKSQFRIAQSQQIYSRKIEDIRNDYEESKNNVPQMLDLSFYYNQQQVQGENNEQSQSENLSEVNLNSQLLQLLEDIGERGTLQKKQLKGLQVLAQIGMFKSKRSPLIIMQNEYRQWKDHYSDIKN